MSELRDLLQQDKHYIHCALSSERGLSMWLLRAGVNPKRQCYKLSFLALEPVEEADAGLVRECVRQRYGINCDMQCSVRLPASVKECLDSWPLLAEWAAEHCGLAPEDAQTLYHLAPECSEGQVRLVGNMPDPSGRLGPAAKFLREFLRSQPDGEGLGLQIVLPAAAAEEFVPPPPPPPPPEEGARSASPRPAPVRSAAPAGEGRFRRKGRFREPAEEGLLFGRSLREDCIPMRDVNEESGRIAVEGEVFRVETRETRGGKTLVTFDMTDQTSSVTAKFFAEAKDAAAILEKVKEGAYLRVAGDYAYDAYAHECSLRVTAMREAEAPPAKMDQAAEKRIELHLHTQMSAMDATTDVEKVIRRAAKWGHPAIAITDHGVVQAFPAAFDAGKKAGIKVILGVEGYLVSDRADVVRDADQDSAERRYVALDIETTGLDPLHDRITEIGAVRYVRGEAVEKFQTFVNPEIPIPANITHLTGITDEMVAHAPDRCQAIQAFLEFAGTDTLSAHNASFDLAFLRRDALAAGRSITAPVVDTLELSRLLLPTMRRHRLNDVASRLGVTQVNHHRADDDALVCGNILMKLLAMAREQGVERLGELNTKLIAQNPEVGAAHHIIILVKNQKGLKNLYELISRSMLDHFHKGKPRMPKSLIDEKREGLLLGSACEAGELFTAILHGSEPQVIREIASWYDYLEVQPLGNNAFLTRNGTVADQRGLEKLNEAIIALGEELCKPVVATGDVHFLDPQDEVYRRILMYGQKFQDADAQPPLYFRTTEEMLAEFSYLSPQKAHEIVVENPALINSWIETVDPLPPYKLYAPSIEGAADQVLHNSYATAKAIYGDPLPEIVEARLKKELDSIVGYGFSVLYLIAAKLVIKSNSDGYLVGSRGSVGSSLVATMTGITEVNPLPPHYVCKNCKHSDFDIDTSIYGCGPDLPDANCPVCGTPYTKLGYDIPFEVFLGFKGDKVPDIDLNFSGDYQPRVHKYIEVLLGEKNVFRAGTIGTIAEKTAYGYVKNYLAEHNIVATNAEMNRLAKGCTGVKRTTGQHPGGIIVVPADMSVYDFTAIQHPADDQDSSIITTHFDFNSLHDRLVKLDVLGHDDPTVLRMLQDITGIDPKTLPLDDPETMKIFAGTESLGITPEDIHDCQTGTLAIPEFGTKFVRQMLVDTRPTTMAELLRISGLSHGTDVWLGNAQDLIVNKIATLKECICTRDDIMNALIAYGVPAKVAFDTMESVRKGKGLKPEMEEAMQEHHVPEWFADSCRKIGYMFPKAHAAAYVMMAVRIAWYKVHIPLAFYAAYFTVRANDFDASIMMDPAQVRQEIAKIDAMGRDAGVKEKNVLTILEVVQEMNARGIRFAPVDLYASDATRFLITDKGIRPPFTALPGLGATAAKNLAAAREEGAFLSVEDIVKRSHVSRAVIDLLRSFHCLDGLPETSQLTLFDML